MLFINVEQDLNCNSFNVIKFRETYENIKVNENEVDFVYTHTHMH